MSMPMDKYVAELAESVADFFRPLPEDEAFNSTFRRLRRDPLLWTEQELFMVQQASRHLCSHNEFAIAGLEARKDYIIGDGFQYRVEPLPGVDPGSGMISHLADWLEDFVAQSELEHELPAEFLERLDEDGEAFLRLFDGPQVRWVEPEAVRSPSSVNRNIRSGIEHRPGDRATRVAYWIDYDIDADPKPVSAVDIVHERANVRSRHARGVPLYYSSAESLRDCESLLRGMSASAKARAKIAVLWQVGQLNQRLEDDLKKRITQGHQTEESGQTKEVNVEQYPFGAIIRYGKDDKINLPGLNIGSADTVGVLQARLRAVSVRTRMPEWMFTGLADQKYSNAFITQAPTYKSFKRIQGRLVRVLATNPDSLIWRAIQQAVRTGQLPPGLERLVRITCTAPALADRDQQQEATVNQTYWSMGVKSIETIQEEQGLDPEQERKRGAKPQGGGDPGGQGGQAGGGQPPTPGNPPPASPGMELPTAEGKNPPGQNPPHPGLVYDPDKKRYVNPNKKTKVPRPVSSRKDVLAIVKKIQREGSTPEYAQELKDVFKNATMRTIQQVKKELGIKTNLIDTLLQQKPPEVIDVAKIEKPSAAEMSRFGDYFKNMKILDRQNIYLYTNMHFDKLNELSRKNAGNYDKMPKWSKQMFDSINDSIEKAPKFEKPINVFRGLQPNLRTSQKIIESMTKAAQSGAPIKLPSLTSTTTSEETARNFAGNQQVDFNSPKPKIIFSIKAKQGLPLGQVSQWKAEEEILMSAHAEYKVVSVGRAKFASGGDAFTHIQLEQV